MDLESTTRELKMLASKEKTTAPELDRAKDLMVELKGMGMSNSEIAELSGGRWSESTAKGYTRGVKASDPQSWQSTTALFSEMLAKNLTLADVSNARSIAVELEGLGSSLADVVSLMEDLKREGVNVAQVKKAIDIQTQLEQVGTSPAEIAGFVKELRNECVEVPTLVSIFSDWYEAGLTPAKVHSALSYMAQLKKAGLDLNALSRIAEVAGKFGGSGEVLEAVGKYGNLVELDQELQKRQQRSDIQAAEMESRTHDLDNAGRKLEKLRQEIAAREKALAIYERLKVAGFDEKTLAELAKAAGKYGKPPQVLMAINRFGDLSKIKAVDIEWRNKIKRKRESLKSLEKQRMQVKEPLEMCKNLLERKFGLSAIQMIDATARKYGEPIKVMEAIEKYGAIVEIDQKSAQAQAALAEIEGKIEVLKETFAQQNARNRTILDQFETLNAKAIEVGRAVGSVEERLKVDPMSRNLMALLQNPTSASYEDSLPLILAVLNRITAWAAIYKSKFRYSSLVNGNLEELLKNLGAV